MSLSPTIKLFLTDDSGATAIEYGLIAAMMAILLLASFALIEDPFGIAFQAIANQLNATNGITTIQ
ncbi:Flp family type IVb pilin [Salinarimonas ramus]|uniref:Flp family type IVb pilin n=1 Tax=Salinarimonas ramus TaxID=690164 RepID=A0A917Q7F9_9HYPH|nr:Flp family type IVb pilin [Salinarimonas ramus]GGK32810.1 hypothetical protein GCM10011322_19430 [Salinarimonas ramus]